jgi:O-antigen ligase
LLILNVLILPFIVFYSIVKNEIRELTQESIAVRISIVVFVLLVSSFVIGDMEYNSVILALVSAAAMFLVSLEYTIPKILSRK